MLREIGSLIVIQFPYRELFELHAIFRIEIDPRTDARFHWTPCGVIFSCKMTEDEKMQWHLPDETLEDLGRSGFFLIQKKRGFRFGEDTVVLSSFVASFFNDRKKKQRGLELGTNCGAASILLAARCGDITIDGVERDPISAEVFSRNIRMNHLEKRVFAHCLDLRVWPTEEREGTSYDFVFFNPPYRALDRGKETQKKSGKELLEARFEVHGRLEDFLSAASRSLTTNGRLFFVHRAGRLDEAMTLLEKYELCPECLQMVHPAKEKAASLFLLRAKKGGKRGGFRVLAPLFLRGEKGRMSDELRRIYEGD